MRLSRVIGSGLRSDPEVQASEDLVGGSTNQLEDDLLTFLGKIERMQKQIDEMKLNGNPDAELIAKVVKERDQVLAEREQHSEENRKLKQRVGELKRFEQKVRDEKKAALKAKTLDFHQELDWQLEQNDADRIRLEQCKQEIEERKTKVSLDVAPIDEIKDQSAQQIADLTAENTRLRRSENCPKYAHTLS